VNRRAIKNATVSHAVYDGYGASLPKGCHPMYVLFVEIAPTRVDVNVHPTKREVRFADQAFVHQTIRHAIRDAISARAARSARSVTEAGPGGSLTGSADQKNRDVLESCQAPWQTGHSETLSDEATPSFIVREAFPLYLTSPSCDVICFGQISRTFLVSQIGTELLIIDQHTAHERVLFERLWRAWTGRSLESQPLLIPEPIETPPHAAALLRQHIDDLATLGLDIEPFSGTSFLIRSIPALLGHVDHAGLVQDLIEDLAQWNATTTLDARIRPVLASLACHAAVRAGRTMAPPEMKRLIDEWILEGRPAACPHGRRVALRFTGEELAKIFGRA
jgi:DNA mismatch repair protein MutL